MATTTRAQDLTVITWNIDGKVGNISNIAALLKEKQPDVLCLQELHLKKGSKKSETIEKAWRTSFSDYNVYFALNEKSPWHGVATLVLKRHSSTLVEVDPLRGHPKEGRILTVLLDDERFAIVNTYVPNSGVGRIPLRRLDYRVKQWDPDLCGYLLQKLQQFKGELLWCGDFNVVRRTEADTIYAKDIHYKRVTMTMSRKAGLTPEERVSFLTTVARTKLLDAFRELHPRQELEAYTFFGGRQEPDSREKGWRLDYQLYRSSFYRAVKAETLRKWPGSDHVPLLVTYQHNTL